MPQTLGEDASARIAKAAAERMRQEIRSAGGREVFFAGSLDANGRVERVRVCARGTETAVPAFLEMLAPRDVILHNHPGGDIAPSEADLHIATICGKNGHGVCIVDSEVSRVYVVVEPFLDNPVHKLDPARMAAAFMPNSAMARVVPHFEMRPQQQTMMAAVARAFNHNGVAVIEAPTGVGKTFAYLVPAVEWALRNRERVVISTRTINLQEQIVFKDVPVLQKCMKEPFTAVLVKGRSNYLCRRKLARALSEATLFQDDPIQAGITALGEWVENTPDGSLSDLAFVPGRDLWERVCAEADACGGMRCPTNKTCFVTKARREVAKANLIIANHHILFSDVNVKKEMGDFSSLAVLPAYHRVIFDEAHSIEDSATEYFGAKATRSGALILLGRFQRSEHGHERGLLPTIKARLAKEVCGVALQTREDVIDAIDNGMLTSIAVVREAITVAFDALASCAAQKCGKIGRDIKWRLTPEVLADPDLREIHNVYVLPAVEEIRACIKHCMALLEKLKRIKPEPEDVEQPFQGEMSELSAYATRLEALAGILSEVTSAELEANTVRWIEIDAEKSHMVRIVRCPLDVGRCLSEWVYGNLDTVVMTSATLSVQRSFDYLFERIGLNHVSPDRIETAILDTPFNYQEQAMLCVAHDIANPDDKTFLEETVECIKAILAITRGHALLLFTSFYALDFTFRRLEPVLDKMGIVALKQGGATRTQLLDRFRNDLSSVLFATDSFWEGVDVVGKALQCVIVLKLPFRVPTEPIQQARAESIEAGGGNSFMAYTVPQAVIKFRQGFGRLIRHRSDRGVVVVLDRRVLTKYYGKVFLESLPGVRIVKGTKDNLYETLKEFFGNKHGESHE